MRRRVPMTDADEYNALTRAKKFYHWRPGQRKAIKRRFNRRERRFLNHES